MKESPPSISPSTNTLLQEATTSLTTLQSQLPQIHHFKSKWSIIKKKLTTLQTHLTSSDFPLSSPLTSSILIPLTSALTSAHSLSLQCSDPSPDLPGGNLRTQSDVDCISSQLDLHLHDLLILLNNYSSAATSASLSPREAVRCEVRDLLTRLQIGSLESKNAAVDCLVKLLGIDDKNVLIAVGQGVVPVLVKALDTTSFEMKEKLLTAIARVSEIDSSKHVIVAEGLMLLNHLIRVLECGTGLAKEKACVVLYGLSLHKENARAIGSCGGISSLLEICYGGTPNALGIAAGVLRNLAKFEEIKDNFVEENAVPVLVSLSGSGTSVARENAIGCLANLVCGDETLKVLVARDGGVESLKNYWESTMVGSRLEVAVELLRNLASYPPIREVLVTQGFQLRFVAPLNCGVLAVRIAAAGAVYELGVCSKARRDMGECGCVSGLARMVDGKAVEEKEAAAKALSRLLLCHQNRKVFRNQERGIAGTVQLMDPLANKHLDKKWPVAALLALTQSKKCRKQMVAAGACVYLQKLVELEVDGAKKLLESLGKGKLWGVFARP